MVFDLPWKGFSGAQRAPLGRFGRCFFAWSPGGPLRRGPEPACCPIRRPGGAVCYRRKSRFAAFRSKTKSGARAVCCLPSGGVLGALSASVPPGGSFRSSGSAGALICVLILHRHLGPLADSRRRGSEAPRRPFSARGGVTLRSPARVPSAPRRWSAPLAWTSAPTTLRAGSGASRRRVDRFGASPGRATFEPQ